MNIHTQFNGISTQYANGRPSYPSSLIKYLSTACNISGATRIADIGSGTGILTKQLLDTGATVYGIEPNDEMRKISQNSLSCYQNFFPIDADSSDTTLDNGCINLITAAQSFHWFDTTAFKKECHRILADNGKLALIWNIRTLDEDINISCYNIYKKYCPAFHGFSGGIQQNDPRIKTIFDNRYNYKEFDNPIAYDISTFLDRCLSSSYVLSADPSNYPELKEQFERLFYSCCFNGTLKINYKTVCYLGN